MRRRQVLTYATMGGVAAAVGTVAGSAPASAAELGALAGGDQRPVPAPNALGRGYYEYLPKDYDPARRWPLLVFLHGVGQVGNGSSELGRVARVGLPLRLANGADLPAIALSPQTNVSDWPLTMMESFIANARKNYPVDPNRIYLTGLSLGGLGTWRYLAAHPAEIAGAVPICGAGSSPTGMPGLSGVPIWAFHNDEDRTVPYSSTTTRLTAITGKNPESNRPNLTGTQSAYYSGSRWEWRTGEVAAALHAKTHLTRYDVVGHDAWSAAYANHNMYYWLWKQTK